MSTRINPDTSVIAGRLKTDESKQADYYNICFALSMLGASHYEQIASHLKWDDPNKVSRRMKEMLPPTLLNPKGKNLIYNTGAKGITKRNRAAYLYDLIRTGKETTIQKEKLMEGKSISDYSKDINLIQKSLFDNQ